MSTFRSLIDILRPYVDRIDILSDPASFAAWI